MTREGADAKGRRYLTEGRLIITAIVGDRIAATCRGDGEIYDLGATSTTRWCSCPARGRCAHLIALGLVTATPRRPTP